MFRLHTLFANRRTALGGAIACALVSVGLAVAPALARAQTMTPTGTPAGTMIDNVAALSFTDIKTGPVTLTSNKVSLQVQEVLDVSVEVLTPELEVEPDTHNQRLAFRIRNLGNGFQAFDLSLTLLDNDDFDPHSCTIWVDWDGNDKLNVPPDKMSDVTPVLAPGQAVVAWVSCSIPTVQQGARAHVLLRAWPSVLRGGTTAPTTPAGNGGVYVVMGPTLRGGNGGNGGGGAGGGTGGGTGGGAGGTGGGPVTFGTFRVGQVNAQLIKTQSVVDVAGGSRAAPGSIVTYNLEARFGAGAGARQVKISDVIPTGSTYVPDSLTLDGAALSDAEDADAGRFAAGAVEVGLGDVDAKTSRFVTFKVRIDPLGSPS